MKRIKKDFEKNKKRLDAIKDEGIEIEKYIIFNYPKVIYRLSQSWFKGESNSPTERWYWVDEDFNDINIYEILIDINIYNIFSLMKYFRDNSFTNK